MINTVVIAVCYLLRGEKLEYVMLKWIKAKEKGKRWKRNGTKLYLLELKSQSLSTANPSIFINSIIILNVELESPSYHGKPPIPLSPSPLRNHLHLRHRRHRHTHFSKPIPLPLQPGRRRPPSSGGRRRTNFTLGQSWSLKRLRHHNSQQRQRLLRRSTFRSLLRLKWRSHAPSPQRE